MISKEFKNNDLIFKVEDIEKSDITRERKRISIIENNNKNMTEYGFDFNEKRTLPYKLNIDEIRSSSNCEYLDFKNMSDNDNEKYLDLLLKFEKEIANGLITDECAKVFIDIKNSLNIK